MAEFKIIETQEQLDDIIGARLKRERETLEKKYANYLSPDDLNSKTEGLNSQIAELQKSLETEKGKSADYDQQIADLNAKVAQYEISSVKNKVAAELGLPYELIGRVQGTTEEEIRNDTQSLLGFVNKQTVLPMHNSEKQTDEKSAAYKELLSGLHLD